MKNKNLYFVLGAVIVITLAIVLTSVTNSKNITGYDIATVSSECNDIDGVCCTEKTCAADYTGQCGSLDDSCGGTLNCDCLSDQICDKGICKDKPSICIKLNTPRYFDQVSDWSCIASKSHNPSSEESTCGINDYVDLLSLDGSYYTTRQDGCIPGNILMESYCLNGKMVISYYQCSNGYVCDTTAKACKAN
jgi:hypothetical protein